MKTSKIVRAKALLLEVQANGHVPMIEKNWLVFRPPLPLDQLMEASELSNELVSLLENERKEQG